MSLFIYDICAHESVTYLFAYSLHVTPSTAIDNILSTIKQFEGLKHIIAVVNNLETNHISIKSTIGPVNPQTLNKMLHNLNHERKLWICSPNSILVRRYDTLQHMRKENLIFTITSIIQGNISGLA